MKKESSGVQTVKYTRVYEQIRASKGRREELLCEGFYDSVLKKCVSPVALNFEVRTKTN